MSDNLNKINQLLQSGGSANVELAYQLAKSQDMTEQCYYLIRFGDMLHYLRGHIINLGSNLEKCIYLPSKKDGLQNDNIKLFAPGLIRSF
jgi:hypothetical protein